jgi:cysteine desulfurase
MSTAKHAIYLDYNASAPLLECAKEIMLDIWQRPANASAVHGYGRGARSHVENARGTIAKTLGIPDTQIVFNSGATEGNNTIIKHFKAAYPDEKILISAVEHRAVLECGVDADHIPVSSDGVVDLNALESLLKSKTSLVSVMLVNNESGVIQPIKEIAALAHRHGALLHCDAVQAYGRIPVDMNALDIDFLTLSAHKIGGPQGVGALAMRLCGETPVLLQGGGQEKGARAGTENVAGIAGFGVAAQHVAQHLNAYQDIAPLRDTLETQIAEISPEVLFFGQHAKRVSNTSFFSLPGVLSGTLMMSLDLDGIAISSGSACSSGRVEQSHVLKAMGISDHDGSGALRVSMGLDTTQDDVDVFLASWTKLYNRLKPTE